ncbi:SHOCT domain-containing protein [Pseudomonas cremoricolorata]|uniref:SHOCT domain-containing protein n=1 Tax=Pseudomonas cremoricolorata TaxID=157783 RepID=UPI00067F4EDE|nr:SHOCT domain-containing protein [Pseudomonas cremoricolorata]
MLANSKGRSFWGFTLLSVITSPLLGLIIVLIVSDLNKESAREAHLAAENERHLESIKAIARSTGTTAPAQEHVSVADELEKLAALKERGVLTDEEFSVQKKQLLQG